MAAQHGYLNLGAMGSTVNPKCCVMYYLCIIVRSFMLNNYLDLSRT